METSFNELVYQYVRMIPQGCVASYGQIAMLCGRPRASRIVGGALHRNPGQGEIPCHRVVFKNGALCESYVFGGAGVQREMLLAEGVTFLKDGRVDMDKHMWDCR